MANKIRESISQQLSRLRQNTSFLPSNITDDSKYVLDNINNELDKLMQSNEEVYGDANIASLYNRLANNKVNTSDGEVISLDNIFNSKQLTEQIMPNFIQNRQLLEYEEMIDTIIKYMPIMQDVLNVKKDHVLCADKYTKDFINVTNIDSSAELSKDEMQNSKYIKDKYDLIKNFDSYYDITANYGEVFIWIKGYNEEISRLLRNKNNSQIKYKQESFLVNECFSPDEKEISNKIPDIKDVKFTINFNENGYIASMFDTERRNQEILQEQQSLGYKSLEKNNIVPDKLGFEGIQDGLVDTSKVTKNSDKNYSDPKLDLKGCIVRRLKRENVIPFYLDDDTAVGYFYIECDYQNDMERIIKSNTSSIYKGNMANLSSIFNNTKNAEKKTMLSYLSDKLSNLIDEKFVKDNQDLKKEIYLILKNNEIFEKGKTQINATFIPPSDIVHMKFDEDSVTHRGLSDLDRSIVPASMYVNLYTTNTIGIITRGFDKRVYYVKNRVDTNIARTLLNVMNQLKRGNMGTREISNPKTALGITGRYNDILIPVGQSGDAPVTMENMPGQDIDTKQELMETLKELAIGPTDVPIDYVDQQRQTDFATRLTMTSYKFLRAVYKRQAIVNPYFSAIYNKIHQYEFPDSKKKFKVSLPSPAYINQMGAAEVYRVTNEYSQALAETEFVDQNDPQADLKKRLFISQHNKFVMGSQLDTTLVDRAKEYAELEAKRYTEEQQ